MAYKYHDVINLGGTLHKLELIQQNKVIKFDNGSFIEVGGQPLMGRIGLRNGILSAVMKIDDETIHLIREDGTREVLGQSRGNWPAAIGPTGDVFIQDSFVNEGGITFTDIRIIGPDGIDKPRYRTLYGELQYINENNIPIMAGPLVFETVDGTELCCSVTRKDGAVGATCDKYTNSGSFFQTPQGRKYFYNVYTQKFVFVASNGTQTWACIQGQESPEPDDLDSWSEENPPEPGYNPKQDLIVVRTELDRIIGKL